MIRYLKHTDINKLKWDTCITSSAQSLLYAESWFLDIVSPGWDALVEDDYKSVFPLTKRKKFGINYLFQPFFTQQLGLFSIDVNISENKVIEFLSAIPGKFKLIEIQLNSFNYFTSFNSFTINRKLTCHLSLSESYEKIRENYSENLRRNIKKSLTSGIETTKNVVPEDIISLFRLNKGLEINKLKEGDYKTFLKLLSEANSRNLLDCRGILDSNGNLIAGCIFLKSKFSFIFLFSATNKEAKETGAMSLLIDSFIKEHSNEDNLLDFEGSMDINLARFYKSFGSKEVVYLQIQKNNLPVIIRWLK